jgi:modification methylase
METLELNQIYLKDCIKGLKRIEKDSVDIIITSPPYNLGNNHHTGSKKHNPYNDNIIEKKYQQWQIDFLNECFRVLKDSGSMFYNHKNRIKDGLQITPYEWIFKTNFLVKQELVWINRSQNFDKIRFYPWTERIYWLVKNKKTKLFNHINHHDVFDWKEWRPVGTKGDHTRAFPEKMVEDILSCFPKSKIVLDPFLGSGTTLVVAKKMKKDFIGFENNKTYYNLAKKRLHD